MSALETIVARRRDRVLAEFGHLTQADREDLARGGRVVRDFAAAIGDRSDVAVIAEVKKASPSAGPIAPACDASAQALAYEAGGAAAVSVLTEPDFFGGSYDDLADVAGAVGLPVLAKDFVVDPVQIHVARGRGADAVLLMVSVLGHLTRDFARIAVTLGMTPLVEIASEEELAIALGVRAGVIAVNARDFRTLKVDPVAQRELLADARRYGVTIVAASGVACRADVERAAAAGAGTVLVGELLMRASDPRSALGELTGVPRVQPAV